MKENHNESGEEQHSKPVTRIKIRWYIIIILCCSVFAFIFQCLSKGTMTAAAQEHNGSIIIFFGAAASDNASCCNEIYSFLANLFIGAAASTVVSLWIDRLNTKADEKDREEKLRLLTDSIKCQTDDLLTILKDIDKNINGDEAKPEADAIKDAIKLLYCQGTGINPNTIEYYRQLILRTISEIRDSNRKYLSLCEEYTLLSKEYQQELNDAEEAENRLKEIEQKHLLLAVFPPRTEKDETLKELLFQYDKLKKPKEEIEKENQNEGDEKK